MGFFLVLPVWLLRSEIKQDDIFYRAYTIIFSSPIAALEQHEAIQPQNMFCLERWLFRPFKGVNYSFVVNGAFLSLLRCMLHTAG